MIILNNNLSRAICIGIAHRSMFETVPRLHIHLDLCHHIRYPTIRFRSGKIALVDRELDTPELKMESKVLLDMLAVKDGRTDVRPKLLQSIKILF